jgi:PDZ domain-containing protein
MTHTARAPAPAAVIANKDDERIDVLMSNAIVPPVPPRRPALLRGLRFALPLITVSWLVLFGIVVMAAVRIQRFELAPGEAMAVAPRIEFAKSSTGTKVPERFRTTNGIKFVTAFGGQLSILDSVLGWIDPYVQVDTYEEHFGTSNPSTSRRLGFQAMIGAKEIAEFVAMKKLGLDVKLVMGRVVIEELVCDDAPKKNAACTNLEVGETITHLDGVVTPTLTDLAVQMKGHVVGDTVELTVIPYKAGATTPDFKKAEKRTVQLMANADDPTRPIIGFVPADTRTVSLPFEVKISTSDIGGPSAGLAFALALLDELTSGNLMGTSRVVATGTISNDGSVGAIGALEQKAVAVKASGADLFLVPAGQSADEMKRARNAAGSGVKIVQVATLDEALKVLRANGGNALSATTA